MANCKSSVFSTDAASVLDPNSKAWKNIASWAEKFTVPRLNPNGSYLEELRQRLNAGIYKEDKDPDEANSSLNIAADIKKSPNFQSTTAEEISSRFMEENRHNQEYKRDSKAEVSGNRFDGCDAGRSECAETVLEGSQWEKSANPKLRLLAMIACWTVCAAAVAWCSILLVVWGLEMPLDYLSLWLQVIYTTFFTAVLVMQPLIVAIITLCKVLVYRVFRGYRGCMSSWLAVPLYQTVAIWRHYRAVLGDEEDSPQQPGTLYGGSQTETRDAGQGDESALQSGPFDGITETSNTGMGSHNGPDASRDCEQKMEKLARAREMRFARPPSEAVLLQCRLRELKRQQINSFLLFLLQYLALLTLLVVIACNTSIVERGLANRMIKRSINTTCWTTADEYYTKFSSIESKADWWNWTFSELMSLTYNYDEDYTSDKPLFCDSNNIIIGMPRIRKYSVDPTNCDASTVMIDANVSMTSSLGISNCYPDYKDQVQHLSNFNGGNDKKYEWDAHYLSVLRGLHSQYSYTKDEQTLPTGEFSALLYLITLQAANWLTMDKSTRAVITEFALYQPESQLYSTISYITEFPAVTGADKTVIVESTHIQRYRTFWSCVSMYAEVFLIPIAMHFVVKSALFLYRCRLRFWKSFWGVLDIIFMVLLWAYIICLMLRVDIAEDLLWQLKVSYYERYANLKSAMTWDSCIDSILGLLLTVHILRCLWLFNFFQRFRALGLIVSKATQDIVCITIILIVAALAFVFLGFFWLNQISYHFHSVLQSSISVFAIFTKINSFMIYTEDFPSATQIFTNIYYSLIAIFLLCFSSACYFAAFLYAKKTYVHHPRPVEITLGCVWHHIKHKVKSIVPFCKRDSVDDPCHHSTPDTVLLNLYKSELDTQLNHVMNKLDKVCNSMGLVLNEVEEFKNTETSSMDGTVGLYEAIDRKKSVSLIENTISKHKPGNNSRRKRGDDWDGSEAVSTHVDGFTEVPSLRNEVERGRNLVAGLKLVPGSLSVSTRDVPRQMVYDEHGEQLIKFLNDVHAASDENIAGTSFSKYGKHYTKIKQNFTTVSSKESLALLVTEPNAKIATHDARHSSNKLSIDDRILINERLRKTETLGRCKDSNDFWELDYLDLSDDEQERN